MGLKARGLHGVEFVVADDHAGLRAALREVLAEAAYQRFDAHNTKFTRSFRRGTRTIDPPRPGRVPSVRAAGQPSKGRPGYGMNDTGHEGPQE